MSQRRGMLRRSQQWRIMATRPRHHAVAGRSDGKRLGAARESSGAVDEARGREEGGGGSGGGGIGIGDRDGRGSRIVSFEERIQVVLVPTRQELHEHQRQQQQLHQQRQLQLQQERLQQQQQQQQQQRQQEEKDDVGGRGVDAVLNEGIWWTRSDCNRFRRSFKRQILQQGLQNNVKTLLCPTLLVFRIGAEEERLEEQEKGRREEGDGGSGGGGDGGRLDGGPGGHGRATLVIAQDVAVR